MVSTGFAQLSPRGSIMLSLVSHHLCPYVQRAVIALTEKGVAHERSYIDLADRPDWFREMSPLGKVPLLLVDGTTVLFESAVICEYLEETAPGVALHPADPLTRARHRAWIEFASATLNDIWGLYTAPDATSFEKKRGELAAKFLRLEEAQGEGPYFAGRKFSLVDAAFGPVFRYFDVFEKYVALGLFEATPKTRAWRAALAARPSVHDAVTPDYGDRLAAFLLARQSHLSRLMERERVRIQ
jgi:glutathione S-transferase